VELLRRLWSLLATGKLPPPKVHVLIIHVRGSVHVTAHVSKASAEDALRGYMESFADDARWPGDFRLAQGSDSFQSMITAYFEDNKDESYLIRELEVQGIPTAPDAAAGATLYIDD